MTTKTKRVKELWNKKSPAEIVLVMYQLIDNSTHGESRKTKIYAVMKGIVSYLERGDELLEHHREYLRQEWDVAWEFQKDKSVKEDIKEWLLEPPF